MINTAYPSWVEYQPEFGENQLPALVIYLLCVYLRNYPFGMISEPPHLKRIWLSMNYM